MEKTFKVGDRVCCVNDGVIRGVKTHGLEKGREYTVVRLGGDGSVHVEGNLPGLFAERFELVTEPAPTFKVGDRVRVGAENQYLARAATYTVDEVQEDGTLDCGDASDGGCGQLIHPDDALKVGEEPIAPAISESARRKGIPLCTGVLDYFPAALEAVAKLSKAGNDKHNPGQPLHHARGKSMDHADCILRHLADRGTLDAETGLSHSVAVAWRALAMLQEELEAAGAPKARGAK